MKKILVVLSDEAYDILKRYKEAKRIGNLDSALDDFLKEKGGVVSEQRRSEISKILDSGRI